MEALWQEFKPTGTAQFLALDCYNGSVRSVQSFIEQTGATFPVLRNGGYLQGAPPAGYGLLKDNYVVVDKDGIVRYTSVGEVFTGAGYFNETHVRAAVRAYLPLAIAERTWSGMKELYR